ncbi:phosphatase PAP2 family protein [candidate division KSB1 bacterium]|nr:phosphatase PAP2 family protein [candidate division KSB1 bacterium]
MINTFDVLKKIRPLSTDRLEDVGDILQYLLPWSALLAVALMGDKQAAWNWFYSGSVTVIITFTGKFIFNFTSWGVRPNGEPYSFPSGHTSSAFMGAAFIHFQIGWMWAIVPYLLAVLTGYSRIRTRKHWLRDVITGAVLGVMVTYIFIVDLAFPPLSL